MMTQDEVLKELRSVIATNQQFTTWTISTPHIVELVNRAIKQEREACAVLCEQLSDTSLDLRFGAAIRARGQA
jgi:hypothetical protein